MKVDLEKEIHINAPDHRVWFALTNLDAIAAWTSNEPLRVETTWQVGSPIVFRGILHGRLRFENTGTIRAFETKRLLEYSHYSSLSRRAFSDALENHALVRFVLEPTPQGTVVTLILRNLHDEAVRGHLDFHWDMTLPALKSFCEAE